MKILVTGAAGFIGSQLTYKLWKDNNDLVLIDNFSYGTQDNLVFEDKDFRKDILRIDIRDKKSINDLLRQHRFDCIYHMAGIAPLPDCQINPSEAIEVNVIGTVNILEASRKFGLNKFIFASTAAIYENDSIFPSVENKFELPSLIYPNTKYTAERFCYSYYISYGISVSCLRFANVYGPHIDCLRQQPPFIGYMIRELYYNRAPVFFSDGNQRRDYIFIDDLIDLALKAYQGFGFDCINVSSGVNYSVKELYNITSSIMNKPHIKPFYENSSKYWLKYPELYNGKYPIREEILSHEVNKFTKCSNLYACNKYEWKPTTTIENGLKISIEYAVKLFNKKDQKLTLLNYED